MGGYATNLILARPVVDQSPAAYAAVRAGIDLISTWLLIPSLVLVLLSGLFAIAANLPFAEAPWVWVKAGTGILVFESTLHLQSVARSLSELAAKALAGEQVDVAAVADSLHFERMALWVMIFVSLVNVVFGVWRPRLKLKYSTTPAAKPDAANDAAE